MRMTILVLSAAGLAAHGAETSPGNARNPQAVQEVLAGKRTEANPAWWGFSPDDSTEALQAAIGSGARKVFVPFMGQDWVVRPIALAGNQELVLENGVVITAKRAEYRGRGDAVFTAKGVSNLVIRGYGATLRMQKKDYMVGDVLERFNRERGGWNRWFGLYTKAEWRTALSINGSTNVKLLGLTLRDSGGDGVIVMGPKGQPSRNIEIRDAVFDNHYRQGISVISVEGLLVENSVFRGTWGTPPSSGVDIEPDSPWEKASGIVFRNCDFVDNYGDGIEIFLANLKKSESGDVSILFDACRVSSRDGAGIRMTKIGDDGPGGVIEFRNTVVESTEGYGIKVQDKSVLGARVRFVGCTVRNARRNRMYDAAWTPVWLHLPNDRFTKRLGGMDFVDVKIEDGYDRPAVIADGTSPEFGLEDVTGVLKVRGPAAPRFEIRMRQERVTLRAEAAAPLAQGASLGSPEHVLVYREAGRFGGWPANHGLWSWGNEILVGFSAAWFKINNENRHLMDRAKPEEPRLARSLDGGRTWSLEAPPSLLPPEQGGAQPADLTEPMDFTHPCFAMTIRLSKVDGRASYLFYSTNRGKTWKGPFRFPSLGLPGIDARTDYLVNGKHDAMVFLTASKTNGREGRPFCARTTDGGKSWQFGSWIGPEPEGFSIMPSTVRLSPASLLTTVRRKEGATEEARDWIDAWLSSDNGASWNYLNRPVPFTGGFSGNPPCLIRLRDGRIVLTYGFRGRPYGIRARLSTDNGETWGEEIRLRDDGAAWDLGYPRSVERPDGKIVSVYYFADSKDGERLIRATIWEPDQWGR